MSRHAGVAFFGLMLVISGVLWATEAQEQRERAEQLRREAAELQEQGKLREAAEHREQAERLQRDVERSFDRAWNDERSPQVRDFHRQLERLRREHRAATQADDKELAERVEREIHRVQGEIRKLTHHEEHGEHHPPRINELRERLERMVMEQTQAAESGDKERAEDMQREIESVREGLKWAILRDSEPRELEPEVKLEHMRAAIEHLKHARLYDIAKHVAEHVEATERELEEHRRRHAQNGELREAMEQIYDLRREVQRLREQLESIQENR